MKDCFKSLCPGQTGFTWSSPDGARASRIDLVFSRDLEPVSVDLEPAFFTDHSALLRAGCERESV